MKTVIVFLVLLATVYCHPVKRSASSSESSEEVVRPSRLQLKAAPVLGNNAPAQAVTGSDESSDSSDEAQSEDSADTDEDDSDSDESEETEEPTTEPPFPFETTLVPFTDSGRGDNLGYPSDYKKSIIYVETNKIDKSDASPYKYYEMEKAVESMGLVGKKASAGGNDIEKNLKVYKALQVHDELLEEDTSTPEVESQGLEEPTLQQEGPEPEAAPAESEGTEEESVSTGESSSASTSEEEEESQSSQSSEETTATPGDAANDSDSSQSSESQDSDYSEAPVIITTK